MGALLAGAAIALVILFIPGKPTDEVVVLPSADGHVGMVVVQRGSERYVLNQPYAVSKTGQTTVTQTSAEEVKQGFGNTLFALPARPAKFTLYFESGTDELTETSRADLQRVLEELKHRAVPDIAVIGHTDTVGDMLANDALSAQRAATVKGFLVATGIAADRIQVSGRGEREPIIATADNVDEPLNRRVEINVR
jgi:outer membrane protein OmpA-like peptidoglycan-associated protein